MTKWRLILFFFGLAISSWSEAVCAELLDPTKPPNPAIIHNNSFVLTAILIGPDHKLAVINGKIVHVGDQLDTAKVLAIEEDSVELIGPAGKFSLTLLDFNKGPPVKTPK